MEPTNLVELISSRRHLENVGITFIEGGSREEFISYGQLYSSALKTLFILQQKGVRPGNELILQVASNKNFIVVFWSCILGGIIPIPLAIGQNDDHKQKLFNIWPVLKKPFVIITDDYFASLDSYVGSKGLETIFSAIRSNIIYESDIVSSKGEGHLFDASENDIAFVQFSSGSTGDPKGVVLSHQNLIDNIKSISDAASYSMTDSMLSWMPLTHDMGLIGFHLNPMFVGMQQYLIATSVFVRNPAIWLQKASEHKTSILCSPNFGYRYTLKHCGSDVDNNWDLSHVRILYNGAEPISANLCEEFLQRFSRYGLRSHAICPVYGLAEASLAVSISGMEDEVISLDVYRKQLNVGNKVSVVYNGQGDTVTFVCVGKPIKCCQVRIADNFDSEVPEEVIGHIQISGGSVTSGYYNNKIETEKTLLNDGWLRTGDLGFLKNGNLYVTGRGKDIIFVNGQNYYPHDIERVAEELPDIELNKIAVAGYFDHTNQREEIIAFVLNRGPMEKFAPLVNSLKSHINVRVGFQLDHVIPVSEIPKTTSGKLQRFKLLERYRTGQFGAIEAELNTILDSTNGPQSHPVSEVERRLLNIWKTVLANNAIDVSTKFFEAGGNSLKAAEMGMAVLKEFGAEIPFETLYEKQTIRELASGISTFVYKAFSAISVSPENHFHEASSAQSALYYTWETDQASVSNNIPVAFRVSGKIIISTLEDCVRQLIARHDALRMSFVMSTTPHFRIHDHISYQLECIPCSNQNLNAALRDLVRPFDLKQAPLFRIKLLEITRDKHYVLFTDFHHTVSDGISIAHFIKELISLYNGIELPRTPVQYKDYVRWEKERLNSDLITYQERFWIKHFEKELPVLELPYDFHRPPIFTGEGGKIEFELDPETFSRLQKVVRHNGWTLHGWLFTIYNVLLSRYTGREEIIVGIPVAVRRHPNLQNIQGMFVNSLAIRSKIEGHESFLKLLDRTTHLVAEAMDNQEYPFQNLVRTLGVSRDMSRHPVFDTMFVFQNAGAFDTGNKEFTLSRHFFDPGFSKFDISVEIFDEGDTLKYAIEYATRLFKCETISRFAAHFEHLINAVLDNPQSAISNLQIMQAAEQRQLIKVFNATKRAYPTEKTIHQLFEEQVDKAPDQVALDHNGSQVTYRQLNERANALAYVLRQNGVNQHSIVGIFLHRSPELVVSILGVLKAGGCYVPVDTDLPKERIRYIIDESKCKAVITDSITEQIANRLQLPQSPAIINASDLQLDVVNWDAIKNVNVPDDLAYIIYTSGTTGNPKGVMIEHRSLVNYVCWAAKSYIQNEQATFALFTSISFDLTVTSIFIPLATGNTIVIYGEDLKNPLEKILLDNKVDIIKLTPSHLRLLADTKRIKPVPKCRIDTFIVGGEQLETRLARTISELFPGANIYNEYGPTEATVGCMIHKFYPTDLHVSVPIGVPAANTRIYILDRFLQPVPAGVKGEIYISGAGLARGYLYRPDLTQERFIANPIDGGRMYKTGDVARFLPEDVIEYLERQDKQVKINGYRIEPSEIENELMQYHSISGAVVALKANRRGIKHLAAFFTSENPVNEAKLAQQLSTKLPQYMIPSYFLRVASIPLTQNGKVNYDALPELSALSESKKRKPANDMEFQMLSVWKDVLNEREITVNDNFFELGGDSIKAVQIASKLSDENISLSAKDILIYHTIEQISPRASIRTQVRTNKQSLITGAYQLHPIQSWFINQRLASPGHYNQAVRLRWKKTVSAEILEQVFSKLIEHHDGLRINYNPEQATLFYNQRHSAINFKIEQIFADGHACDSPEVDKLLSDVNRNFDLTHDLFIRAVLVTANNGCELLIVIHHLVIDGVSWRILLDHLYNGYLAVENQRAILLPEKTSSLLEWDQALDEFMQLMNKTAQEDYWTRVRQTDFRIPQDFSTKDWALLNMEKVLRHLSEERTSFLLKYAVTKYRIDVPILINTALAMTLKTWTKSHRFVIEQENHGRHLDDIDVSRTIGWFTCLYPMLIELEGNSIGDYLKAVKEQSRNLPDQGLGYGLLKYKGKEKLLPEELSEIRLNYLGQFGRELNNELFEHNHKFQSSDCDPQNRITAKFELIIIVMNDTLHMEVSYNKKAHQRSTVNWFADLLMQNLESILDYIDAETEVQFTPSDFQTVSLNQEELNALF